MPPLTYRIQFRPAHHGGGWSVTFYLNGQEIDLIPCDPPPHWFEQYDLGEQWIFTPWHRSL